MILKKNSKFFFIFQAFVLALSFEASGDILEKYLKKDGGREGVIKVDSAQLKLPTRPGRQVKPVMPAESEEYFPPAEYPELGSEKVVSFKPAEERKAHANFSFGASRNHLVNKITFDLPTSSTRKYTPLIGIKLDFNDKSRSYSNIAFSLGVQYVIFRFYGLEMSTALEQELENYFTIPSSQENYTFLTTRGHLKFSYDLSKHFSLFASFSPKISYVSDEYLASAPKELREEACQILDFHYGFLVK